MNRKLLRHELEIINEDSSCVDVEFVVDSLFELSQIRNIDFSIEKDRMKFINDYIIHDIISYIKNLWYKYVYYDLKCRYGLSFNRFFNLYSFKRKYLLEDKVYVECVTIINKCLRSNELDMIINELIESSFNLLKKNNLNVIKYEIY